MALCNPSIKISINPSPKRAWETWTSLSLPSAPALAKITWGGRGQGPWLEGGLLGWLASNLPDNRGVVALAQGNTDLLPVRLKVTLGNLQILR